MNFEHLEDRRVLANIFWNADADGFWDIAANWKDEFNVSRLPAADDDVFLDRPTGVFTVTHRSSASSTVRSLHADRNGFVLAGGSLAITAASELRGNLAISGGNLDLDGPLTTAGTTTWTVGLVDGGTAGLTNTGTLTLTDSGLKRLSGNLLNAGTITHASTASDLVNSSLGTLTNLADGVYDFQGDQNVAIETFINRGTLRKSAGAGTTFMSPRNFSNEGGTIDVQSGTLQISGPLNSLVGGLSTGGFFSVSSGAVLDLTGPGNTVHFSGTYTGSGAGIVRVRAGVLQIGAAGATFNFPPGLFQWLGGIIAAGATGLTNTDSISLAGSEVKFLSGLFNNAGTVTHTGTGDLQLGSFGLFFSGPDGTFNNLAGGLYDLASDARFANGVFNNAGTMRKSAGSGVATVVNHRFNNVGGTIDVRSGTFLLQGTSGAPYPTHTGGTFTVAAGAFLDLTNAGGIQVFTGDYTGAGAGLVRIVGAVNTGAALEIGAAGVNFDFPTDRLQWIGGVIDAREAPLTNRRSLTLNVNAADPFSPFVRLRGTLNNAGTILHFGDGAISINGDSGRGKLINQSGGVYEFRGNGSIELNSAFGPGAELYNAGTLRKSAGSGVSVLAVPSISNDGGAIDVQSGTLQISGVALNVGVAVSGGGVFTVAAGAVLDLTSPGKVVQYNGSYTGSGAGTVRVRGGTLQVGTAGAAFNFSPGLFLWDDAGAIDGGTAGLTNVGYMTLDGLELKSLTGVLNNAGTITHRGSLNGNLSLGQFGVGTLNNLAGGVYDFANDTSLRFGVFNNAGTVRKSGGALVSTFIGGHRFNNLGGTIDVQSGTLSLVGSSGVIPTTHTGGNFLVASGAVLEFTTPGSPLIRQVLTGNYTGSGGGIVRLNGGTIEIGPAGAAFDFPEGLFEWSLGQIDGRTAPLTNRGAMSLVGFGQNRQVLHGTLLNAGKFIHVGDAALRIDGQLQGDFTNLEGGLYEFQGDGGSITQLTAGAQVHNFGTIRKSTGTDFPSSIATNLFDNAGTLEVNAGTLLIGHRLGGFDPVEVTLAQQDGDALTGGTWKVQAGASLEFDDYPRRFVTNAATVVLDGVDARFPALEHVQTNTGSLTLAGGRTLSVPVGGLGRSFSPGVIPYALAYDPTSGNLFAYAGSATEIREYTADGAEVLPRIPFPGGSAISVDLDFAPRSFTLGGTLVPTGTLLVIHGSGATLYGVDRSTGEALASVPLGRPNGTILGGSYHAGRNTMFLIDSATAYEFNPATGELLQSFPIEPPGSPTYSLSYGDLDIDPHTGNLLIASGTYDSIRELTPSGQFVRDQSTASLGLGRLSGLAVNEATRMLWVSDLDGRVHELTSLFTNAGSLTLGPGSGLDVPGSFTQGETGTLSTHVGGDPASGKFGRVAATGTATFAGAFAVTLLNNFGPTAGQQFPIVRFSSPTGGFTEFSGLSAGRNSLFAVNQLPTSLVLDAIGSAANLAFDGFVAGTFPPTATPGQTISITYDVRNLSDTPGIGDWVDSLYLSQDATLDEHDVLLGRVDHRGGLSGLASYRETLTAPLPPLAEGSYRVIVLSDSRGLVTEANRANNVGFSTTAIAVTVPLLPLGTSVSGNISAGEDRYFRLLATPGSDLKITADFSAANTAEVFLRHREIPDLSNFDQVTSASDAQQRLLTTNPQGGSYYLLVHGRAASSFTLRADTARFEIVRLAPPPLRGSNQGQATIDVIGSQFTSQTTVRMFNDSGASRTAQSIQFVDPNHLRATFDLTGLPTTNYRVEANDPGASAPAFALDTFTVTDEPPGIVSALITSPAFVRVGAPIAVDITIINGNDAPAIAPILEVIAANVASGQERRQASGSSSNVLPGVLPPLYEGGVGLVYTPNPKARGVKSTFNLSLINPSATLIDWESLKETLRPTTIPTDAWDAIWSNLRSQLGNTMADLYAVLQRDAEQLALLNIPTNSISRLFKYELRKANDLPAVPVPAAAVDVSFPAPGLPLVWARDFGTSIADRFNVGRLGRGWVDNFEYSLDNDTISGVVSIHQGRATREFAKDKTGAYYGMPGDFGTLTELAGTFQLREKSGEVIGFRQDGRLDFLLDTNGNRITAGYTGDHLTSLTHSNGSALTLTYNAQGRIQQVIDPAGRMATYNYDASGQHLLRVTTVEGTTEYAYTTDATGPRAQAIASIAFPAGTHVFFDYDSQGRLARQERDGGAEALTLSYHGIFYRIRDALGDLTDVYFDDLGNTKQALDGLTRSTRFGHTLPHSFLTRIVAPDGNSSTFQYDPRGNVVQSLDPLGHEQQSEYEPTFNNLVGWRDALGRETGFNYDASGNPLSTTYPDGTLEEFGHDPQGNLLRSVNRRGQLVQYTHDTRGLVTRKDLPDGTHVDYVYDTRANLISATDPSGTTTMEYNVADRLTKVTYSNGRFLSFDYDAGGRRIRSTDQSGFSVNYRYDPAGHLAELTDGSGQRLVLYQYDPAGRLTRETRGNGVTTTYEYDAADQLLHLIHLSPNSVVLSRFDYTYDENGCRTSMTTLEGTTEYVYDAGGQLVLVLLPSGRLIRYEYDAAGNRREVTDNGVTTNYTINELNQNVVVGETNQSFDADGNLTSSSGSSGPQSFAYDAEGRLVSAVTSQGTWNYEYDILGNRVATIHNGQRSEYLIDPTGLGNVYAEYDGSGAVRAHFAHGLGLVSRVDANGPVTHFQYDAGGNTAQLTGAGGAVLNTYSYLPFGETLSANETIANPFTFVGQFGVMREGIGLDYMRNRWYDPVQGRFTQQDPIGLVGGTNLYAYVRNNPACLVDPSGLTGAITPVGGLAYELAIIALEEKHAARLAAEAARSAEAAQIIHADTQAAANAWRAAEGSMSAGAAQAYANSLNAQQSFRVADVQAAVQAQRLAQAPSRAGIIGLAIQTGLALFSLKRGLKELAITGDLPDCALGSNETARIFELCKGPAARPEDILDLVCPLCGGIMAITSTEQREPSFDPNDLSGPAGVGVGRFVADRPKLPYTIQFENIPAAIGPAAQVVVTQTLDDDLDLDTFELGDFGFGELVVDVPDGRQYYSTRIDLRATRRVFVDLTAQLNHQTRVVNWTLTALDPATLDIPSDPSVGFLPPDKIPPEGQGFVNYSVRPKADAPTGTRIDAQATIVFDTNEPIETPRWFNTLDLGPPTSRVNALPASSNLRFSVSWSGSDDADGTTGSGIASYDVYVSDNGAPFVLWLDDTPDSSATFTGQADHTYGFYSAATDAVGHVQVNPSSAQATTTVGPDQPGDANRDGIFGPDDLILALAGNKYLTGAAATWEEGDWNGDGFFDSKDLVLAFQTGFNETQNPPLAGDADRNGRFDSADIVLVFQAGKYETGQRARWEEGDWDSNDLFDSGDLVAAFQAGRYEQPPAALQSVFSDDPVRRGRRHRGLLRTQDIDIMFAEWVADDRLQSGGGGKVFSDLRRRLIR